MDWYQALYTGTNAHKKREELIQKLESGKTCVNVYLITLPQGRANQLEIIPAWNLRFWYPKKDCPPVIGLACGRDEARELVLRITQDVLQRSGSADIRAYFEQEMR